MSVTNQNKIVKNPAFMRNHSIPNPSWILGGLFRPASVILARVFAGRPHAEGKKRVLHLFLAPVSSVCITKLSTNCF